MTNPLPFILDSNFRKVTPNRSSFILPPSALPREMRELSHRGLYPVRCEGYLTGAFAALIRNPKFEIRNRPPAFTP